MDKTRVMIGIQARSTSERFPRKHQQYIGQKQLIRHVIDSCKKSADFLNKKSDESGISVNTILLIPKDDPLRRDCGNIVEIFEGDEHDVLSRYMGAVDKYDPAYICRITGDCPFLYPDLISFHIKKIIQVNLDYLSNVDPKYRTFLDGWDVEVISSALLRYAFEHAAFKEDREHVTTFIRREPPSWAKIGHVMGFIDLSELKLSVDTPDDLERVIKSYTSLTTKLKNANEDSTHPRIYRY